MKTKIIATIGPASEDVTIIKHLVKEGMNIARFNTKYTTHDELHKIIKIVKKEKAQVLIDLANIKKIEIIEDAPFDYLALSFTESSNQIKKLRKLFLPKKVFIIAKIESSKGIKNLDEIITASDGLMVARGDLGKNVPIEKLPIFQKRIIKKCNLKKKFVITATEMLLSMTHSKTPERAEVSDVANAVLDGSNAVMLSEETAIGENPVLVVSTMREIVKETEKSAHLLKR